MSLQQEMRAQDLGRNDADPKGVLPKIREGGSLADTKADGSGANMLLLYLLTRWGRLYSGGATATLAASEPFQNEVVDAYLAVGCAADEAVPARDVMRHLPRPFIDMGSLPGQVSALSLAEHLREQVASWGEEPAGQLERLHTRLSG